jgi:TonB family protein
MANKDKQLHQIDDFLLRIEARERSRRRNQLLMILGLIVLVGGGFQGFRVWSQEQPLRSFQLAALDYDQVKGLFQKDSNAITVYHTDLGTDTVYSAEEFLNLQNLVSMMESSALLVADGNLEDGLLADTTNTLAAYILDVAGTRNAGEALNFVVENYDPAVSYLIDFGNGYRRRIRQSFSYTYPGRGQFQARLIATLGEASSVYIKNLSIGSSLSPSSSQSDEQIASGTPESARRLSPEEAEARSEKADSTALPPASIAPIPRLQIVDLQATDPEENDLSASEEDTREASTSIPVAEDPLPSVETPGTANAVLLTADITPEYPGGNKGIARYFQRNYRYPADARRNKIEGVVYVRFVVQANGDLSDFTVVKKVGYGCDEEAIRLLASMPKWRPAEHQGKTAAMYKTLPITFKLLE